MNKVMLIGNLTADPELKKVGAEGISFCSFRLAVQRRFANAQGVKEADFINIVTWRQLADTCSKFLAKGRKCAVNGSLQTRTYEAQDGTKRYIVEVAADEVEFLSPRTTDNGGYGEQVPPPANIPPENHNNFGGENGGNASYGNSGSFEETDDELPF